MNFGARSGGFSDRFGWTPWRRGPRPGRRPRFELRPAKLLAAASIPSCAHRRATSWITSPMISRSLGRRVGGLPRHTVGGHRRRSHKKSTQGNSAPGSRIAPRLGYRLEVSPIGRPDPSREALLETAIRGRVLEKAPVCAIAAAGGNRDSNDFPRASKESPAAYPIIGKHSG